MPPAGAKAEAALRKKKDAKQKKILLALLPVLLLLLVWQGPGMLSAFSGGAAAPATPPTPTVSTTSAPADPTAAAPSTSAPGADPAADPTAAATLPESDVPVAADSSQLVSFDRFIGKDPFKQQIAARNIAEAPPTDPATGGEETTSPPGDSGSGGSGGGGGDRGGGGAGGGGGGGTPITVNYAVIDTNGDRETVGVGGTFPVDDPIFRLASLTSKQASIGLVSGSFSNGRETVKVAVGDSITLVSQPDGIRYKITIASVG